MASPIEVRTQREFAEALRELVSETGKSPEKVADLGGLRGNTVRGIIEGKHWPQERTLAQLVRACGQDPRPWVATWRPLNDARPRQQNIGQELQERIDALEAEVGRLRGQVRHLRDSFEQGEGGDRRRERRMADAYNVFLTEMPVPDFRRVEAENTEIPSPVLRYTEPASRAGEVSSILSKVNALATVEGLPELARYLATAPLAPAINAVPVYGSESDGVINAVPVYGSESDGVINAVPVYGSESDGVIHDFAKSDVDAYLAELRACVHRYLRACTDEQVHGRPDGAATVAS